MNLLDVCIETNRLKLIPTSNTFAKDIFTEFTQEITRFMYPKSAKKITETREFIKLSREKMEKGEQLQVVILNKITEEFIGHAGINHLNFDKPEPGIWIKKGAFGLQYGREAVHALVDWLNKNYSYTYIRYPADKKNIASRKIAESLGGVLEAEYEKMNASGNKLQIVEYRIYPKLSGLQCDNIA